MARWLLKTEPSTYSWDDLVREGRTVWDGISNPLALKNLRAARPGDELLIYHTGSERRVVGVARVVKGSDSSSSGQVEIAPEAPLPRPVGLDQMKKDKSFAGWELLRLPRLSVVPVPDAIWRRLMALARTP
ncbi:MAG: EVE domain-containing protein [Candidatus Polarisedimenticolia bacterium]